MNEYELGWAVFHIVLGLLSYTGIVIMMFRTEPKPVVLRFKTLSEQDREYAYAMQYKRLRGYEEGKLMLVVGYNSKGAEETLREIKHSFSYLKNIKVLADKRDYLSIAIEP